MQIIHTVAALRDYLGAHPNHKRGFVPTMGNLHAGHLALIAQAKDASDIVIASIFVNRLQFLPHEDFDSYPRTWDDDVRALTDAGCDVLFAPREADLYPEPQTFKVHPDPTMADILEGEFRPGFFTGVCTVVLKLCQIVQPHIAVFGKKDYQQLAVIRQMVRQLALPIEILAGETLRAEDGLALSSRNRYLSISERGQATQLSQTLRQMADAVSSALVTGALSMDAIAVIEAKAMQTLRNAGWQPDYLAIRTQSGLQAIHPAQRQPWIVLGAARLGTTRLIDNLEF
jgi:pantoate--beta-alanine ligase